MLLFVVSKNLRQQTEHLILDECFSFIDFFLINYPRSSTLRVSQNFSNLVLIPCSVGVVLLKSLCHFRLTTVPDSNLTMSRTILTLISINPDFF